MNFAWFTVAQCGIREFDAKTLIKKNILPVSGRKIIRNNRMVFVTAQTNLGKLAGKNKWLKNEKLVVKPDQLFGKRGKNNLILLDASFKDVKKFIKSHMGKEVTISGIKGKLEYFLIEPYVPHTEEYYVAIRTKRDCDEILFSINGGVEIEKNWRNVSSLRVPILDSLKRPALEAKFGKSLPQAQRQIALDFIESLYKVFTSLNFAYLEINPFTVKNREVIPLDVVARLDDTAAYECKAKWNSADFPVPFGRKFSKEEKDVKEMDENSGSSMKLTILNPDGKIWSMVAGGGASVIYADTVCDLGFGNELANYGEYSGNPTEEETYQYAKTILDLMTHKKNPEGKYLFIGGGIANFTDVSKTFGGIIRALKKYAKKLRKHNVTIYVRRGGPNYAKGLEKIKQAGNELNLKIQVFGPETHMTKIVSMALE